MTTSHAELNQVRTRWRTVPHMHCVSQSVLQMSIINQVSGKKGRLWFVGVFQLVGLHGWIKTSFSASAGSYDLLLNQRKKLRVTLVLRFTTSRDRALKMIAMVSSFDIMKFKLVLDQTVYICWTVTRMNVLPSGHLVTILIWGINSNVLLFSYCGVVIRTNSEILIKVCGVSSERKDIAGPTSY